MELSSCESEAERKTRSEAFAQCNAKTNFKKTTILITIQTQCDPIRKKNQVEFEVDGIKSDLPKEGRDPLLSLGGRNARILSRCFMYQLLPLGIDGYRLLLAC